MNAAGNNKASSLSNVFYCACGVLPTAAGACDPWQSCHSESPTISRRTLLKQEHWLNYHENV